jgi:putative tricarboxylic transport membrane protein
LAIKIRSPKDFFSGMIFIVVGILALVIGRDYSLGTATRMGPGYFPALLGGLLTLLGAIIAGRTFLITGKAIDSIRWRPLLLILASMFAFAMLLEPAGLIIATVSLVIVGCLASTETGIRDILILIVFLLVVALGLFVYGLGLPIKIWPWS